MKKIKSIVIPVCMALFFIVSVQILLSFQMGLFDLSAFFFYAVSFLMLFILIGSYFKKIKPLFISAAIFMIAFMFVKISLKNLEDYYWTRTVSKGAILKEALTAYKEKHRNFPETLKDIYKESGAGQYNIGLLKYYFGYYKTDTSYRLYFNHFHARTFINYGESNTWEFSD